MSKDIYSLCKPHGRFAALLLKKRQEMFSLFLQVFPPHLLSSVLDVGVTADKNLQASNYFEMYFPDKAKITALSDQNAEFLQEQYPGLTFQLGDARELPFADSSRDVVFSSAVIEHVGSLAQQKKMLAECFRVAKKGVFITTPNRWYPFDLHTLLPFIHWLPKKIHRAILKSIGLSFYAKEKNLNLLDEKTLINFCHELAITNYQIKKITLLGCPSNLILILKKCSLD